MARARLVERRGVASAAEFLRGIAAAGPTGGDGRAVVSAMADAGVHRRVVGNQWRAAMVDPALGYAVTDRQAAAGISAGADDVCAGGGNVEEGTVSAVFCGNDRRGSGHAADDGCLAAGVQSSG